MKEKCVFVQGFWCLFETSRWSRHDYPVNAGLELFDGFDDVSYAALHLELCSSSAMTRAVGPLAHNEQVGIHPPTFALPQFYCPSPPTLSLLDTVKRANIIDVIAIGGLETTLG